MSETAISVLYDGFREYQLKVKGYLTCTPLEEIQQWEEWKKMVFDSWEKKKKEKRGSNRVANKL